jgi:hypothetical protein
MSNILTPHGCQIAVPPCLLPLSLCLPLLLPYPPSFPFFDTLHYKYTTMLHKILFHWHTLLVLALVVPVGVVVMAGGGHVQQQLISEGAIQ